MSMTRECGRAPLETNTHTHTHTTHTHTHQQTNTHLNVVLRRQLALGRGQQLLDAVRHDPVLYHIQLVQLRDEAHVAHHTLLHGTLHLFTGLRVWLLGQLLQ